MEYLYLILIAVAFFAMTIIPQRRRQKRAEAIRNSLHSGMKVRTAGGFLGTIVSVTEDTVVIECSPDKTRLEILKGAVMPSEEEPVKEPVEEEAEKPDETPADEPAPLEKEPVSPEPEEN